MVEVRTVLQRDPTNDTSFFHIQILNQLRDEIKEENIWNPEVIIIPN